MPGPPKAPDRSRQLRRCAPRSLRSLRCLFRKTRSTRLSTFASLRSAHRPYLPRAIGPFRSPPLRTLVLPSRFTARTLRVLAVQPSRGLRRHKGAPSEQAPTRIASLRSAHRRGARHRTQTRTASLHIHQGGAERDRWSREARKISDLPVLRKGPTARGTRATAGRAPNERTASCVSEASAGLGRRAV